MKRNAKGGWFATILFTVISIFYVAPLACILPGEPLYCGFPLLHRPVCPLCGVAVKIRHLALWPGAFSFSKNRPGKVRPLSMRIRGGIVARCTQFLGMFFSQCIPCFGERNPRTRGCNLALLRRIPFFLHSLGGSFPSSAGCSVSC